MFNGVLLVAIIATWILKVTSLPKLYYRIKVTHNYFDLTYKAELSFFTLLPELCVLKVFDFDFK